jgi:hypothetical protein
MIRVGALELSSLDERFASLSSSRLCKRVASVSRWPIFALGAMDPAEGLHSLSEFGMLGARQQMELLTDHQKTVQQNKDEHDLMQKALAERDVPMLKKIKSFRRALIPPLIASKASTRRAASSCPRTALGTCPPMERRRLRREDNRRASQPVPRQQRGRGQRILLTLAPFETRRYAASLKSTRPQYKGLYKGL